MPIMALGTWLHKYDFENQMADAVVYAINKGYKHIDCAYIEGVLLSFCIYYRNIWVKPFQSYLNETEIGGAFARTIGKTVKREDLFITAKLWNHSHQPDQVEAACDQSMRELGLDYLDLYLMHFPT